MVKHCCLLQPVKAESKGFLSSLKFLFRVVFRKNCRFLMVSLLLTRRTEKNWRTQTKLEHLEHGKDILAVQHLIYGYLILMISLQNMQSRVFTTMNFQCGTVGTFISSQIEAAISVLISGNTILIQKR